MSTWQTIHDFIIVTCSVAFALSVVSHYAGWSLSDGVLLTLGAIVSAASTPRRHPPSDTNAPKETR
jgi:hypothetical protein